MKKITCLLIVTILIIGCLVGCGTSQQTPQEQPTVSNVTEESNAIVEETEEETKTETEAESKKISFGDTITFDDLEITFGDDYSFVVLENEFSDFNNADVIELPVHVKNVGDENNSLSFFMYQVFGSKGVEVDKVSTYFDNDIDDAGDLKPGAEYDTYFHLLYDGDGEYSINFNGIMEDIEADFDIVK